MRRDYLDVGLDIESVLYGHLVLLAQQIAGIGAADVAWHWCVATISWCRTDQIFKW